MFFLLLLLSQLLQEKLTSAEEERDHLSTSLHEMNETLSGSEQKRLSEQQAHLELLKGAEGEAARLRGRIEELTTELSVSRDKCEVGELHTCRELRNTLVSRVYSVPLTFHNCAGMWFCCAVFSLSLQSWRVLSSRVDN